MTEAWFTEKQVEIVARDMQEGDRTMADAMDAPVPPAWGNLSEESQKLWLKRARERLAAITPLDITKPLKLRDGTSIQNVRLSEDGLQIFAEVPAWDTVASWPLSGTYDEPCHMDMVYIND